MREDGVTSQITNKTENLLGSVADFLHNGHRQCGKSDIILTLFLPHPWPVRRILLFLYSP